MSYRTVKRLLGETSLERKCRYLFGGGLLLLIVASFYVYAQLTSNLVYEAVHKQAQRLASSIILEKHITELEPKETVAIWKRMINDLRPAQVEYNRYSFFKPLKRDSASPEGEYRPSDPEDYDAVEVLLKQASEKGEPEHHRTVEKEHGEYQYFKGVIAQDVRRMPSPIREGRRQRQRGGIDVGREGRRPPRFDAKGPRQEQCHPPGNRDWDGVFGGSGRLRDRALRDRQAGLAPQGRQRPGRPRQSRIAGRHPHG